MATNQPLLQSPKNTSYQNVFLILSIAAIIGSISLFSVHFIQPNSFIPSLPTNICDQALDKKSCIALVLEVASNTSTTPMNKPLLLNNFLKQSTTHIQKALEIAKNVNRQINNSKDEAALLDCIDLIDLSLDRVKQSITSLQKGSTHSHEDAHAWLSGVLTNYVTCFDGLEDSTIKTTMEPKLKDLISRARTSLAMIVTISPSKKNKMLEFLNGDVPKWVSRSDLRLLEGSVKEIKANVVVAKDGSGNYKTVKEAVEAAPSKSKTRYVIYVKKGIYKEKVEIGSNKKNLMIVGDGMDNTVITGNLNVVDGSTTFNSATVAAVGDGFIAQDLWFQNTAGPQKHQAVALRVGSDQSVINRCRIDAYQDTLYTHTNRQFYRDSSITGTVDFIFGNAAVVLQNCKIIARKPMSGQNNMVTAQGREDPNQNTGTSIQKCDIIASSDLEPVKGSVRTYLGRPWKEYSRTVVMQSNIGNHIDPSGWSIWSGEFALKTLYYGEYANKGAGAGVSKRVKWPGYHVITNPAEAKKFTVSDLIQGGFWLKSTGVAYTVGL